MEPTVKAVRAVQAPTMGAVERLVYAEAARRQAALCSRDAHKLLSTIRTLEERLNAAKDMLKIKERAVERWHQEADNLDPDAFCSHCRRSK